MTSRVPLMLTLATALVLGGCDRTDRPVAAARTLKDPINTDLVNRVMTSGALEIELSQLAQRKAASPDVKALAGTVIRDRREEADEVRPLIARDNIVFTINRSAIDPAIARLTALSGEDFDRAYIDLMVKDLAGRSQTFHSTASANGGEGMMQWATGARRAIDDQLERAREIQRDLSR